MLLAASTYATIVRPLQALVLLAAGLFFLRVVGVASREMRPIKEEKSRRSRRRLLALEFIEPVERAGERFEVTGPLVFGRAAPSDVILDDSFLSTQHARFTLDETDLFVEDLGSRNGSYVNAEPLIHRTQLLKGDVVQLGNTILEVVR